MSAFRQLQAIDKQLALLSNNRLGLDGFSMKDVMLTLQEEQKEGTAEEEKKKKQKTLNKWKDASKAEYQL